MSHVPDPDEKGAGDKGLRLAAAALINTRSYKTPEPGMCLVSIAALARVADAIDNPSLAGTIRACGKNREDLAGKIAKVGEDPNAEM